MSSPGGGELSLFACPGVGNRPPSENKIANPRGYARGGGMVTGRIEPCITHIDSPFGISLQASTRLPYHFYQPTRLKVKL